jgi:hypothetical protein
MTTDFDIPDDGFVKVKIGDAENAVDLYYANNRLVEIDDERREKGQPDTAFLAGVVKLLDELGFPGCSHRAASRFVDAVNARVDALKKADAGEPMPGSPASTGPESSEAPPPPEPS